MKILLDTRDLINLVERGRPLSTNDAGLFLTGDQHRLVYCFTNIRELVSPLATGVSFIEVRATLQSLEKLPHTYIKEVKIISLEISEAVSAFIEGREFQLPNIEATRWDQTLFEPRDGSRSTISQLVNLRLDDLVYLAYSGAPTVFAAPAQHLPELRRLAAVDRQLITAGKAPEKEHFKRAIVRHAQRYGIGLPIGREDSFTDWVYQNPVRCLGIRFTHEVYRALLENITDIPETADFSDLALVYAVPYVEAITLDRRMRHYCRIGARRLVQAGAPFNLGARIHSNFASIIRQHVVP
jgi:hypothetical protein